MMLIDSQRGRTGGRVALFVIGVIAGALWLDAQPPLPEDPVMRGPRSWGAKRELHVMLVAALTLVLSVIGGVIGIFAIRRPRGVALILYTVCLFFVLTGALGLLQMVFSRDAGGEIAWMAAPFVAAGCAWMLLAARLILRQQESYAGSGDSVSS